VQAASVAECTGDIKEMQLNWHYGVKILYMLLYLVGITLFTDNNARYRDLSYLEYFHDLEMVGDYTWGTDALTHVYNKLNVVCVHKTKQLGNYMILLQV